MDVLPAPDGAVMMMILFCFGMCKETEILLNVTLLNCCESIYLLQAHSLIISPQQLSNKTMSQLSNSCNVRS